MKSCKTVAGRFVELAGGQGRALTAMQLLKLVYIAHGWMLALYGRPLIREHVEAWQYGPVIPVLYNAIRHYMGNPVAVVESDCRESLDEFESSIVEQTHEIYGHLTGPALSRLTHAEGTPWHFIHEPGAFGTVIPNDLIQDHYMRLERQE